MDFDWLLTPKKLYTRAEVLDRPCPVPAKAGIYGWYFKDPPGIVPVDNAHERNGLRLLYVGIAPKKPPVSGRASSTTLRVRIRQHYSLNGYGSTLRLSLGCLLGLELRRIRSKKNPGTATRMTFGKSGEQQLSEWMGGHAFVVWNACENAWDVEDRLIAEFDLPLNLDGNSHRAFHATLADLRARARHAARGHPPINE